jgi:hypothetical protein
MHQLEPLSRNIYPSLLGVFEIFQFLTLIPENKINILDSFKPQKILRKKKKEKNGLF